jgi:hypothetical protein
MAAIPSSSELYEAGLVAGVTFVAEFWYLGRWCMAVPNDFFVQKTADAVVKCVFTKRVQSYGNIHKRLMTGACTAFVLPTSLALHPCIVQTARWVKTSSRIMSM